MKAFVKKLDANGGIGLEPVFCEVAIGPEGLS